MNKNRSNFLIAGGICGLVSILMLLIYELIVLANCDSMGFACIGLAWIIFVPSKIIFGSNSIFLAILFWFVIGFLLGMLVYKLYLIKNE